jgi:protein-S-isoprenylcysteine O-methyltransferase Ste14
MIGRAWFGLLAFAVVLAVAIFLPAGTARYTEGWAFLLLFVGCCAAVTLDVQRRDPALLARRLRGGAAAEARRSQQVIQLLANVVFLGFVVVPALDHRFRWSHVPAAVVVVGGLLVVVGFVIVGAVFRANSFASATIETARDQRVIDTGPYAVVRHPMYAGALLMLAGVPLALGSYWGLSLLVPMTAVISWRLLDEERFLEAELPGYRDYERRVRHRLAPGVW